MAGLLPGTHSHYLSVTACRYVSEVDACDVPLRLAPLNRRTCLSQTCTPTSSGSENPRITYGTWVLPQRHNPDVQTTQTHVCTARQGSGIFYKTADVLLGYARGHGGGLQRLMSRQRRAEDRPGTQEGTWAGRSRSRRRPGARPRSVLRLTCGTPACGERGRTHLAREEVITMTTPHPATAPVALNPATPAIFGIVGGALGIIGFFLPWETYSASGAQGVAPHTVTYSLWDVTNHALTGASLPGTAPTRPADEYRSVSGVAARPAGGAGAGGAGGARGRWRRGDSRAGTSASEPHRRRRAHGDDQRGKRSVDPFARDPFTDRRAEQHVLPCCLRAARMQVGFFVILVGGIMAVAQARRAGA